MLAGPRAFSQLAASFIASGSLGILRPPFNPSPRESHSRVYCCLEIAVRSRLPLGHPCPHEADYSTSRFCFFTSFFSLIIVNELSGAVPAAPSPYGMKD